MRHPRRPRVLPLRTKRYSALRRRHLAAPVSGIPYARTLIVARTNTPASQRAAR